MLESPKVISCPSMSLASVEMPPNGAYLGRQFFSSGLFFRIDLLSLLAATDCTVNKKVSCCWGRPELTFTQGQGKNSVGASSGCST